MLEYISILLQWTHAVLADVSFIFCFSRETVKLPKYIKFLCSSEFLKLSLHSLYKSLFEDFLVEQILCLSYQKIERFIRFHRNNLF